MSKKILLISERFYPSGVVGAVRPTNMAKYLTERGYEVDVFTKNPVNDEAGKMLFHKLYYIGSNYEDVGEQRFAPKSVTITREKSTLYKKIYSAYCVINNIIAAKKAVKKLDHLIKTELAGNNYDTVISSFGPLSSLICGMHFKKKCPKVKWICDFRDPVVVDVVPKLFIPYYKYLQNKACKTADAIVTVSNGYFTRICGKRFENKAYMIPNGYDIVDMPSPDSVQKNEKLTFAYAGTLYDGKRDISPLFSALRELVDEGGIDMDKITFEYAGNDGNVLKSQADKYKMREIVNDRGRMPRQECLNFQFAADFLVLSTWNYKSEIGVFPGKFLEYMLMQRPIISLTCGDIPNSEITEAVRRTKVGIAYEEISRKSDFPILKDYLKEAYRQFYEEGSVHFSPDKEAVARYDWKNLIGAIEKIL